MNTKCNVLCPVQGWMREKYCPTCTENPANASRKEDLYADSEFASRGLGPYDNAPKDKEHELMWGGEE